MSNVGDLWGCYACGRDFLSVLPLRRCPYCGNTSLWYAPSGVDEEDAKRLGYRCILWVMEPCRAADSEEV